MAPDLPDQALRIGRAHEAELIRDALAAAGLVSDDIENPAGAGAMTAEGPDRAAALLAKIDARSPVATLLRLWQLGEAVADHEAVAALGLPADRLVELGLVRRASATTVAAEVVLSLHEGQWFASDSSRVRPAPMAANFVMPVSGSSLSLAGCVPSGPLGSVVDVGTGSGVQALLVAPRSDRVVGVDVNARALSMAAFNAWLNGVDNVDFCRGSLLEPVAGEQFDLVMANPPFVVSPDCDHLFRDSQGGADELCRALVRQSRAALAPGGMGVYLVNWARRSGEEPFAAPRSWVEGVGLDALVVHHFSDEGEAYARRWLESTGSPGPGDVARWAEHYRSLDVSSIAMGVMVVRRPEDTKAAPWFASFAASVSRSNLRKGDHLRQLVSLQDFLRTTATEGAGAGPFRRRVLRAAEAHEINTTAEWRDGAYHRSSARARIGAGLPFSVTLDLGTADLLARCNGRSTFDEVLVDLAGELGAGVADIAERALPSVRTLLSLGFLLPPEVPDLPVARPARPQPQLA